MKKLIIPFLLFVFTLGFASACRNIPAQKELVKETYIFSIKGTDTLRLDKYDIPSIKDETGKPCIIFVFGGGFSGGARDKEGNVKYMEELARRGYIGIAIDYRLGMKEAKNMDSSDPMAFINLFTHTITIAVEDLFDATHYVYDNAFAWNINKEQIIANGSSAGAITVLQGGYAISNQHSLVAKLPDGFNYAGIISFAGAIFSPSGDLDWPVPPAPIQLFHGDADRNVPYDKTLLGDMGIYGSRFIAEQLQSMDSPFLFYDVENAAHEMADLPMTENLDDIESFINHYVIKKELLMTHSHVIRIGKEEMEKDFTIMDFIQSNYQ